MSHSPPPPPPPQSVMEEQVIKRDGRPESVDPSKITRRLQLLKNDVEEFTEKKLHISVWRIAQTTIGKIYDGITTSELDEVAAEEAAYIMDHFDYSDFAGQILASNLEANNRDCMNFLSYAEKAYNFVEERTGKVNHLISDELLAIARKYGHLIDKKMVMQRNYLYDYFGIQTLVKGQYLLCHYKEVQKNSVRSREMVPFETPQHMWMRVALGIHGWNINAAFEHYDIMSLKFATMATPTLLNAGTPKANLSSCFLQMLMSDSIEGIYDTLKNCALISKSAGGEGIHVHNVRCTGSYIQGTNGTSNGIVPMLRVFNNTARYVDQGGGKRKGAFAIYLEPWHGDIMDFLDLKRQQGSEDDRARDMFYGLWIPDLFMKRVQQAYETPQEEYADNPVMWSLMDPNVCPGLSDTWGDEFEALYQRYEAEGKYVRQIDIKKIMVAIMDVRISTGGPYMLYKDSCNRKSNQQNLGTIKSSNLCTEIVEYSSTEETAVCNLASIALPMFVDRNTKTFDYKKLYEICRVVVRSLDKVIDRNHYPIPEAKRSNMRHRPIGLGIQGLADVFIYMGLRYGSPESKLVNRRIAETMYFAAMTESHALTQVIDPETKQKVGPYSSIYNGDGSPISKGIFQFEMWKEDVQRSGEPEAWKPDPELGWDWESLRAKIKRDGVRNSLTTAPMPTASTSQILGNLESFEAYYGMLFVRRTKVGEFYQYCKPLIEELVKLGLWKIEIDPETKMPYIPMKEKIKTHMGSIQNIPEIPQELKDIFVAVADISLKDITLMARDRGIFTDQSMSLNVTFKNKDNLMPDMLRYDLFSWKLGLKTGCYYTRTLQKMVALNFTGTNVREEEACVPCGS